MPDDVTGPPSTISVPPLTATDFLLPHDQFVERCGEVFAVAGSRLTASDKVNLVDALRSGVSRLDVISAVRRQANPTDEPFDTEARYGWLRGPIHGAVVTDVLVRYAPDDHATFVERAHNDILGRHATAAERLEAVFDLKRGAIDRRGYLEALAVRAPNCRFSPEPRPSASSAETFHPPGMFLSDRALQELVLLRRSAAGGWLVCPDTWATAVGGRDGVIELHEGYVICGPKRTLPAGVWDLNVDIVQDPAAELIVDIVANTGVHRLAYLHLVGAAHCRFRFKIDSRHHFIELRVFKPKQDASLLWMTPRELSLSAVRHAK